MNHRFLTAREVAEMFQLNVDTVYDLIGSQGLPGTKLGGSWRFDSHELVEWFRAQRASVPPDGKRKKRRGGTP